MTTWASTAQRNHPGWLLESMLHFASPYAVFGRSEVLRTDHLFEAPSPHAGAEFSVAKPSLGGTRDLGSAGTARLRGRR